jgi:hypothetical protein
MVSSDTLSLKYATAEPYNFNKNLYKNPYQGCKDKDNMLGEGENVCVRQDVSPIQPRDAFYISIGRLSTDCCCVLFCAEGSFLADQVERWLAGEILAIPYPQRGLERRSLLAAINCASAEACRFCINEPVLQPTTIPNAAVDLGSALLPGGVPADFPLPRRLLPPPDPPAPILSMAPRAHLPLDAVPVHGYPQHPGAAGYPGYGLWVDDLAHGDYLGMGMFGFRQAMLPIAPPRPPRARVPAPLPAPLRLGHFLPGHMNYNTGANQPGQLQPPPNPVQPGAGHALPWANPPRWPLDEEFNRAMHPYEQQRRGMPAPPRDGVPPPRLPRRRRG